MNLRGEAYGRAAHAFVSGDIAGFPWALTASEFRFCYRVLQYGGKVPELTEQNAILKSSADVAVDRAWDGAKDFVGRYLFRFGGAALGFAARSPRVSFAGLAVGIVADVSKNVLLERLKLARVADLMVLMNVIEFGVG